MYQYPYGDYQQLNLDWIINKIVELENQEAGDIDLEEISNAMISLTYSSTQAYNISDVVFYEGHLYRCNTAISAPGETWDPAHWDQIMLGDTVANLVRAVAGINSDVVFNESNVSGTHVTDALNVLVEDIRYNNHWIQKKKNGSYSDAVEIEDTPSNSSSKLASSKAVYGVKNALDALENRNLIPITLSSTDFEIGSISQAGTNGSNMHRIRTIDYISTGIYHSFYAEFDSTATRATFSFYDATNAQVGRTDWFNRDTKIAIPYAATKMRWQVGASNDSPDYTPSDYNKLQVSFVPPILNGENFITTRVNMAIVSDSIGVGTCGVSAGTEVPGQGWAEMLAINSGFDFLNLSHKGMGYLTHGAADPTTIDDVITQIRNDVPESYYNLWVVQLGINDYLTTGINFSGIASKLRSLIQAISFYNNRNARVIVFSPFNCALYGDGNTNYCYNYAIDGRTLKDLCDALETACLSRGIEYINVTENLVNDYALSKNVLGDSVHPQQSFHAELAKIMQRYI